MNNTVKQTVNDRFAAVDAETMQILKGHVSNGSRDSYKTGNIRFLVWIFDNKEDHGGLLKSSPHRAMETVHETDRARRTKACRPSKLRNELCAVCRSWLKEIMPNEP